MVESVATHRKFVGTASLYRHLAFRQPPFLQRDLNFVLDRHEQLLAKSRGVDGPKGEMSAMSRRKAVWDYPTAEMMKDLLRGRKPVLRLDALQIRRHDSAQAYGIAGNRLSRKIKSEPDWLPDPSMDFRASCLITLMFINTGKDLNQQERIHVDTRCGVIESSKAGSTDRTFEVTLDEGFAIDVEKIFVTIEKGSNSTYRWKRSIPAHYQLNIEIKCQDHDDAIKLLSLMERKPALKYRRSLTEKDATLRATWLALPECPALGKSLRLLRSDGAAHAVDTNYGVELSMGWSRKQDLPLVAYAKSRRAAIVPAQDQLLTPSASDESENTSKEHIITYVLMNERSHTMKNLQCPLCATGTSLRARHEFSSFDRLHIHFLLWHDHFQPRVEDAEEDASSVIRKTVHLTLTTKLVEGQIQPLYEGDEDEWIAPQRPFDEKAYLKSEDTWTGHPKSKPVTKQDLKAERAHLNAFKKQPSATSTSQNPMKSSSRPAPPEVIDIPELPKPRWPLPKVPGIRFYRTKSKRPFQSDEEVSESDEDVDESWLQAHKRDDMSSLPLSAGAKDFYQDWNLTLALDDFPADVFAKESLVRFARKFSVKLGHYDEYYNEFKKMVLRLESLNFVDQEVRDYCCKRQKRAPSTPAELPEQRGFADGSESLSKAASGDYKVKTCTCGSPVASARAAVMCDNIRCARIHFHMACVGLTRRTADWLCPECSGQ